MVQKKSKANYNSITKKWGNRSFCRQFSQDIDNWLIQFDDAHHKLLLELLKHFDYYLNKKLKTKAKELYAKFKCVCPVGESDLIFCKIPKKYKVGFSDLFVGEFWLANNLYNNSTNDPFELFDGVDDIPKQLVIVDDMSGSGASFTNFYEEFLKVYPQMRKPEIYFLVLNISTIAIKRIEYFAKENDLKIEFVFLDQQSPAFKKDYILDNPAQQIFEYFKICIDHKIKSDQLGFHSVQSLVSFEYNTPNDTLKLFWKDTSEYKALFNREYSNKNTTLNEIIRKKKQIQLINKADPFFYNINDYKMAQFMIYAVAWGEEFSVCEACSDLGLTDEQFYNIQKRLLEINYLEFKDGKMCISQNMEDFVFSSRIHKYKDLFHTLKKEQKIPFHKKLTDQFIPENFDKQFHGYEKRR